MSFSRNLPVLFAPFFFSRKRRAGRVATWIFTSIFPVVLCSRTYVERKVKCKETFTAPSLPPFSRIQNAIPRVQKGKERRPPPPHRNNKGHRGRPLGLLGGMAPSPLLTRTIYTLRPASKPPAHSTPSQPRDKFHASQALQWKLGKQVKNRNQTNKITRGRCSSSPSRGSRKGAWVII